MEFHAKMQRVKRSLSCWRKAKFGNIFIQISTLENIIKVKESQLELTPTPKNQIKLNKVDLKRFLNLGEKYWKQNAGIRGLSKVI